MTTKELKEIISNMGMKMSDDYGHKGGPDSPAIYETRLDAIWAPTSPLGLMLEEYQQHKRKKEKALNFRKST